MCTVFGDGGDVAHQRSLAFGRAGGGIVSVLMAVIDGLMIQWIADPSATPRSTEVIRALASIGAVVTSQLR